MAPRGVRMVGSRTGHRGGRWGSAEEGRSARGCDEGSVGDAERSPQLLGRIGDAQGRARWRACGRRTRRAMANEAACADAVSGVARRTKEGDSSVSNVVICNAQRIWAATGEVGRVKESRGRLSGAGWGKGVRRRCVERVGVA
jgi:hypothetical protein